MILKGQLPIGKLDALIGRVREDFQRVIVRDHHVTLDPDAVLFKRLCGRDVILRQVSRGYNCIYKGENWGFRCCDYTLDIF